MMTQAERLRHLSGTGWGKVSETEKQDIDIPFFMTRDWERCERRIKEAEEARIASIIGRERTKARRAKEKERRKKEGILLTIFFAVLLLIIGAVEQGFLL